MNNLVKDVQKTLVSNLGNLEKGIGYNTETLIKSKSGSFLFSESSINSEFLERWFKIENNDSFEDAFKIVTYGIGDEIKKTSSLISSSLLSFLCFHKLYNNPDEKRLLINFKDYGFEELGEVSFEDCMFEVRNKVIGYQYPSCMDLLLISHSSKILFFLESKFTEPLISESKKRYGKSYILLYYDLKDQLNKIGIDIKKDKETGELILLSQRDSKYLEGIKQSISHIIGISRGPSDNNKGYYPSEYSVKYRNLFNNPEYKKVYGTILYDHGKLIEEYKEDFQIFFNDGKEIINSINKWNEENYEELENLKIINVPITYQKLFNYKENKQLLSENVIKFYDI